jgi:hypothetical protein
LKSNEEKVGNGLPLDAEPTVKPNSEAELIESDLNSLLERMVAFNEKNPVNGTGTAISKLKQAILFFNKEY